MRGKFLIVLLGLVFCLSFSSQVKDAETSSEDSEKELVATVMNHFNAWNERDLDTYLEISIDSIGFGRWAALPRDKLPKKTQVYFSELFLSMMEISEYVIEEEPIVYVVGDTGLVMGKALVAMIPHHLRPVNNVINLI